MSQLKSALKQKKSEVAYKFSVGDHAVAVFKPTMGERSEVLRAAREAGELTADNATASDPVKVINLVARVAVAILHYPDSGERIFDNSDIPELLDTPWLEEQMPRLMDVFKGPSTEEATGN